MRYLLGLDNGGTETKCSLYNEQGKQISSATEKIAMRVSIGGFTERDSEELFAANCRVISHAISSAAINAADICAIGMTGYGNGLCFTDKEGKSVYPIIVSTDSRAASYVQRWRKDGTAQKVYWATKQDMFASQAPPLIAWFRDNNPAVLDRAEYALQVKDYIRARLTGEIALEYTDMSNSGLIDITRRCYAESVFDDTGIRNYRRLFTDRLLKSSSSAGFITQTAAELTGLKAGTPVCAGLFDIDASCLAAGVLDRDTLCLVGGTWMINEYLSTDISEGEGKMATTLSFADNMYLISDSSATGVSNLNWYLDNFSSALFPGEKGQELFSLCEQAMSTRPFADDSPVFVPYLYSSASRPNSRGAFMNITGADDGVSLLRAVYEGITYSSALHIEKLCLDRDSFRRARLIGGASRSEFWCKMFADVLGIAVDVVDVENPGTLGAALCAGVSCGIFPDYETAVKKLITVKKTYEPDMEMYQRYRKKLDRYRKAVDCVDSIGSL